jgi:hypothetical protein
MLLGQRSQPDDMVPRAIVEDLVSTFGMRGAATSLVIGKLPPALEGRLYLPRTSHVVASLVSDVQSTSIIGSSLAREQAFADLKREMPKLGWQMILAPSPSWGFADARPEPGRDSAFVFCGNQRLLVVTPNPRPGVETQMFVATTSLEGGSCDNIAVSSSSGPMPMRPDREFVPVRLINPSAAKSHAFDVCDRAHPDNGAQDWLQTQMTADELFAYYGKQLADSGWQSAPTAAITRSWARTDSGGRKRVVDIRITAREDAPMCRNLWMDIRTIRP